MDSFEYTIWVLSGVALFNTVHIHLAIRRSWILPLWRAIFLSFLLSILLGPLSLLYLLIPTRPKVFISYNYGERILVGKRGIYGARRWTYWTAWSVRGRDFNNKYRGEELEIDSRESLMKIQPLLMNAESLIKSGRIKGIRRK